MRILLTGACGLLGRAIRNACGDGAHELVLFDLAAAVVQDGGIRADVTDAEAVMQAAQGCEAIIHTAAMHGALYGKASNAEFLRVNVLGAENLFQAALNHGIRRLVFSSTLEILCGRDWGAYSNVLLDESLPPRPDWIYPVSKLMVEQLGGFYAVHHGLEVVNLRYCWIRDKPPEELGLGLLARELPAVDAARANLLAATKPGLCNEVFNIAPDSPLTQRDCNEAIQGKDLWTILERHWPGSREVLCAHGVEPKPQHFWPVSRIDKAKLMLSWQPEATFEKFLRGLGWNYPAPGEIVKDGQTL